MTDLAITSADGTSLSAYRAEPTGSPRGGVLVIQEIFGVNAHIRSVADRMADAGFLALAPALFDRVRPGVELDYDLEGATTGRELAWELLPLAETVTDLEAAADALEAAADALAAEVGGPANVGSVGFCYGGMLSCALASRSGHHLAAAVAYYPSMAAQILQSDQPHVPLLVHLGDRDTRVTPDDGATLEARWPDATFHRYPAGHGFNCDRRADYDAASAATAWERTIDFLAANLAPGA